MAMPVSSRQFAAISTSSFAPSASFAVKSPVLTLANCQLLIANCSGPSALFYVNLRQPLFPLFLCALCALCG